MRLLADTHTVIWYLEGDARLSARAARLIAEAREPVFISSASLWEIGIKVGLEKLQLHQPLPAFFATIFASGFRVLPIQPAHALRVAEMPMHHRDPFDRMLVAQAIVEGLQLVSADPQMSAYAASVVW